MIYDMGPILAEYGRTYVVKSNGTFVYKGITYTQSSTIRSFVGVLQPLTDEDRKELLDLGYAVSGHKVFYAGSAQGKLTEHDTVVDAEGVEWAVLPENNDYSENGGYVKYILSRRIVNG